MLRAGKWDLLPLNLAAKMSGIQSSLQPELSDIRLNSYQNSSGIQRHLGTFCMVRMYRLDYV